MSLISHFPSDFIASDSQVSILKRIEHAFSSGKKFVIVNAPTGSGKSFIAKTIGNSSNNVCDEVVDAVKDMEAFKIKYSSIETIPDEYRKYSEFSRGGTFVLTITKNLQNQYKNLFSDCSSFKGKSNYACLLDTTRTPENADCVHTPTLSRRCEYNKLCPYLNSRNNSVINKFSNLNYSVFCCFPRHMRYREHIICDEASELPNELVSIFSLKIPIKILNNLGIYNSNNIPLNDSRKFVLWLNDLSDKLDNEIDLITKKMKKGSSGYANDKRKYEMYRNLQNEVQTVISAWDKTEYVISSDSGYINVVPLKVDKLSSCIFDYADKIVLMSATIIDHKNFAKELGIEEYEYIEVESEFDPKKAPIISVPPSMSLSKNNLSLKLPSIAAQIKDICKKHAGEKGIIHTHSNEITKFLYDNLKGNRFLYRIDDIENDEILEKHCSTDAPTIIVSPSLSYGVDLKGDLAKFQIIVKASFAPLDNPRISKMFKLDKQWYANQMLNKLIQACGRGVRTKNDECVTYILDGAITYNVIQNKSILPKYFIERFI